MPATQKERKPISLQEKLVILQNTDKHMEVHITLGETTLTISINTKYNSKNP